ncbi:hypothetical protein POSPLADRAFT_1101192, partial [Postia placenta MAD-698-R-SB12]
MKFTVAAVFAALALMGASPVGAGPNAYGICQSGCNKVAVACHAAGGLQFGTVLAAAALATIIACNPALEGC